MTDALRIEMTRGRGVESLHHVHGVVADTSGKILESFGDPDLITYLRSSAKPMQAVPLVESGAADHFGFTEDELAVCCASHAGAIEHVNAVRSILRKADLSPEFLQCRVHAAASEDPFCCAGPTESIDATLRHNCSGKHSGMLSTARYLHESVENYRSPKHPVQQRIFRVVSDLSDVSLPDIEASIIPDGCGAPIYAMPLRRLAQAYARFGSDSADHPHAPSTRKLRDAMRDHPVIVAGEGSWNTILLRILRPFLFAKGGAEGIFGVGLRKGIGVATKVLDGNHRATSVAVLSIFRKLELVPTDALESLSDWEEPRIYNGHHVQVGVMRAVW